MNTFNTYHGIPMYKTSDFVDIAREYDEEFAECLERHLRELEDAIDEDDYWYDKYREADRRIEELEDYVEVLEREAS